MKKQTGFTLIELIAVMVILAILSVVAIPQFVDLRVDAAQAGAAGVGGGIASGSALNYAEGAAKGTGALVVTDCTAAMLAPLIGATVDSGNLVQGGRAYTIAGPGGGALISGATRTCTIDDNAVPAAAAQSFTIVGCATVGSC